MLIRKLVLSAALFVASITGVYSQTELGVQFGAFNYRGDLSPGIVIVQSRPGAGFLFRTAMSSKWSFSMNAMVGRVKGEDRLSPTTIDRNLSFRSNVYEFSGMLEYNLLPFIAGSTHLTFIPYVFAGVGGFYFNPLAQAGRTWYKLAPLGTEGQYIPGSNLSPYKLMSISFPFGVGFKKNLSNNMIFGMNFGLRPTLTDYLDDVSNTYADLTLLGQTEGGPVATLFADRRGEIGLPRAEAGTDRGDPTRKDWYMCLMFSITKRLGHSSCYNF